MNRFRSFLGIYTINLLLIVFSGVESIRLNREYSVPENPIEFIILHNNDMHARFEQTSITSGLCTPQDANTNKCYGGFARVAHEVRNYRAQSRHGGLPAIYLNAGDTYTGTAWFTVFKDNITTAFLNILKPDAISLGNHEFDENVKGLIPFLNNADFPILAANLDLSKVPELANTKQLRNSTILTIPRRRKWANQRIGSAATTTVKIGVVGYLTPTTKEITPTNDVEFLPEIAAINEETKRLRQKGVRIIIAVGHSGYIMDKQIAKECPDVDIVIGGHSNTFLYNGKQPSRERIEGPYPTIVKQANGKQVPVVQAYAYTKYLGKLHVKFDMNGNLVAYDGKPILLNASIPRDSDVLELLEAYRPNITALQTTVMGHTKVYLEGTATICRRRECNMGNLISDSMVYAGMLEYNGNYWTDAPIAFVMSGGIRSSIDKRANGEIVGTDILATLPFNNILYRTKITGQTILNALEYSATMKDKSSDGGFLQMSGVHATFDYCKPVNSRVSNVRLRCGECATPEYKPLQLNKTYTVIVPEFLLSGGDGHVFKEKDNPQYESLELKDYEALQKYIGKHDFVYPEVEGRLLIQDDLTCSSSSSSSKANRGLSTSSMILIISIPATVYATALP